MRRASGDFLFATLPLFALLTSCAPAGTAEVERNPPGPPVVTKPLPPADENELKVRAIEELMRLRQASADVINKPRSPNDDPVVLRGCMELDVEEFFSRYLKTTHKCSWKVPRADDGGALVYHLNGTTEFRRTFGDKETTVTGIGRLPLKAFRSAAPKKPVLNGIYDRRMTLTLPGRDSSVKPHEFSYTFVSSVSFGNSNDETGEFWETDYQGYWKNLAQGLVLERGARLQYTYRAPGSSKETVLTLRPVANVEFKTVKNCPRPDGVFSWTLTQEGAPNKTGQIEFDPNDSENGVKEIGTGTTSAWPKTCIEF